ncbi:MAG: hypothetical protein R3C04_10010 [Hyphomonas sp.]
MTSGVAAVALAASAAFALPAAADAPAARATIATKIGDDASLIIQVGHNDRYASYRDRDGRYGNGYGYSSRYRLNQWGQTPRQVEKLSRDAVKTCRREIERLDNGRRSSFHDVDVESRGQARQIGPYGFNVYFREVEFEGRRRDMTRPVSCEVRQGRVVDIDGVPMERWNGRGPDRRGPGHPTSPRR